jgi:hypothetical protein
MRATHAHLTWSVAATAVLASMAFAGEPTRTVLYATGRQAPGLPAGVNIFVGSAPSLDAQGSASFFSVLTGEGVNAANARALHLRAASGLTSIPVRMGDDIAGLPGVQWGELNNGHLSHDGSLALVTALAGAGVTAANGSAYFSGQPSGLALLARAGQQAPNAPAGALYGELRPAITSSYITRHRAGRVLFEAPLVGNASSNDRGLFLSQPGGAITMIARRGLQALGAPAGVAYSTFTSPQLNADGRVAFTATLSGVGVTAANDQAFFAGAPFGPGGITMIAREGGAAPSLAGLTTPRLGIMSLSDAGTIAMTATLAGPGVTTDNDSALWVLSSGGGTTLMREGDPAPGLAGLTFANFSYAMHSSGGAGGGSGRLLMSAQVAGPGVTTSNNRALWVGPPGALELVMRSGLDAPGLPGVIMSAPLEPCLSPGGEIAFVTILTGAGVVSANNNALWGRNALGEIVLLARKGVPFTYGDGLSLTPDAVLVQSISGGEDGKPQAINDRNEVAYMLYHSPTLGSVGVIADVNASCRATITGHPQDASSSGGPVTLTATAEGPGPLTFRWRRAGIALEDGPVYSGTSTQTLTIAGVSAAEAGAYDLEVSNPCGSVHTAAATVSLAGCGPQDFNGDGDSGTDQDIEAFFACLAGHCCGACWPGGSDFNGDGDFGTDQDIEAFFRVLAGNPC